MEAEARRQGLEIHHLNYDDHPPFYLLTGDWAFGKMKALAGKHQVVASAAPSQMPLRNEISIVEVIIFPFWEDHEAFTIDEKDLNWMPRLHQIRSCCGSCFPQSVAGLLHKPTRSFIKVDCHTKYAQNRELVIQLLQSLLKFNHSVTSLICQS
jgi:hypothetical protein